jgi:ELWxxDGT repeat protein
MSDGVNGAELWATTGAAASTRMLQDLAAGPYSSSPGSDSLLGSPNPGTLAVHRGPVVAGGRLYFAATDATGDRELWSMALPDVTPPVISAQVTGTLGAGGWYTGDVSVTFTVSDAESPLDSQVGCGPFIITTDGTQTLTCVASSAGGLSSRAVTVMRDATAPMLGCAATQACAASSAQGGPAAFVVTAMDGVDPNPAVSTTVMQGEPLPLGHHSVMATATDAAGNVGSCTFDLEVRDEGSPTVVCPDTVAADATSPDGAAVELPLPTVMDAIDPMASVELTPASGSLFPVGTTSVRAVAVDAAGNRSAPCTFDVTVLDCHGPCQSAAQRRSEYSWGCTSTPAATGLAFIILLLLGTRRRA